MVGVYVPVSSRAYSACVLAMNLSFDRMNIVVIIVLLVFLVIVWQAAKNFLTKKSDTTSSITPPPYTYSSTSHWLEPSHEAEHMISITMFGEYLKRHGLPMA